MGIERMEAGRIVGMMIGRQALWRRRANSLRRDGSIANLFPLTGGGGKSSVSDGGHVLPANLCAQTGQSHYELVQGPWRGCPVSG